MLEPASGLEAGVDQLWSWIEVPEGPIRWIVGSSILLIPDSRIKSRYPRLSISGGSNLLGTGKRVRWDVNECPQFEIGCVPTPITELRSPVGNKLSQDSALTEEIMLNSLSFDLETDLARGCWVLTVLT